MDKNSSVDNFWKISFLVLLVFVLFLAVADVRISPRLMGSHGHTETSEDSQSQQQTRPQQSPSTGAGMVGGC